MIFVKSNDLDKYALFERDIYTLKWANQSNDRISKYTLKIETLTMQPIKNGPGELTIQLIQLLICKHIYLELPLATCSLA